jgi:ribose transport system permease protein
MPDNVKKGEIASAETSERVTLGAYIKSHIFDLTAYAGLVIMLILFVVFNSSRLAYNFGSVIQAAAVYAILALGAVFIYSMGFMDVSLGQQLGVYVILMILIGNRIGGVPGVVVGCLVVLALALVCGAINGAVSIFLGLPSIVTSLFLMFFFTGAQYLLMEGTGENTIYLDIRDALKPADRNAYTLLLIGIIVLLAIIATYFFKYTKLGKYTRAIGANKVAAKQSGISLIKWQVLGYMALGFCTAVASFVMLTRTGSAGKGTGGGYAMDIMICLILGGMPLKGGMKSKISSALVGALTYALLGNVLTTMGVPLNWINFVKALIFLIIVLLTCRKPQGVLPR